MGNLIYAAIGSVDGYVEDASGRFDWAAPDEEVLAFVNELERPVGTYLSGRRVYETMTVWETIDDDADEYQYFVNPLVVGGGRGWLPAGVRLDLPLVEERRFGGGVVFLRYRPR